MRQLTQEDKEAIEYLNTKGISYRLIDLSDHSMKNRILAKATGINQTPILVLDNGTKLRGLSEKVENLQLSSH